PVPASSRDHVSDSALGIGHIPGVAWDEVNMGVRHGLASGFANVDPYIVPPGLACSVHPLSYATEQLVYSLRLAACQIEIAGDMAARDDQCVSGRNGKRIGHRECRSVLVEDALVRHGAEWTVKLLRFGHSTP